MAGKPRLITVDEVAALTTLSPSTLYNWRAQGKGPRSAKLGDRVVYDEFEVLEWIARQREATSRGES